MKTFIVALFLTSSVALAADRAAQHPIDHVLSAALLEQQNRIELVVAVTYPNGCYKPVATSAMFNSLQRSIGLTHKEGGTFLW